MSKRRKFEEKSAEEKSLRIQLIQPSDSETHVAANLQDIVSTIRRKDSGKRIPLKVFAAPFDNV